MLRVVALAALAATAAAQSARLSCAYWNSGMGATFDITALQNQIQDYNWQDAYDDDVRNSNYTFNICSPVQNLPQWCAPPPPGSPNAAAYQIMNTSDGYSCVPMTPPYNRANMYAQSLIDNNNPALGFQLTYTGQTATNCPATPGNPLGARQFSLVFQCGDRPFPTPTSPRRFVYIEEVNVCQYQAFTFSQAGCPTECPIVNGAVCNGAGVCGYDKNLGSARCFCDDDYQEEDCSVPRSPEPQGLEAGIAFLGIFLGVGAMFGYSFFMNKRAAGSAAAAVEGFYGPTA